MDNSAEMEIEGNDDVALLANPIKSDSSPLCNFFIV